MMRKTGLAGLVACVALAGCETNWNPVNWFDRSRDATLPVEAAEAPTIIPQDPRPSIAEVSQVTVDRVPGGAIVTAVGIAATQGWFEADLVPVTRDSQGLPQGEDGEIVLRFAAVPPPVAEPVGTDRARRISAGTFLSNQRLEGVRTITVQGQNNRRSARP